jgi:hypothetical protein
MYLERWDENRQRWRLYESVDAHRLDCDRYPISQVPTRLFLDTSVVNLIVKHAEVLFDGCPLDRELHHARGREVEALLHVFAHAARAPWVLIASTTTMDEVANTLCAGLRESLMSYVAELVEFQPPFGASTLGTEAASSIDLGALPDASDRILLSQAMALVCDAFVTVDMKTIVFKRHLLPPLPLRIMTPVEWWAHVKPWARLIA